MPRKAINGLADGRIRGFSSAAFVRSRRSNWPARLTGSGSRTGPVQARLDGQHAAIAAAGRSVHISRMRTGRQIDKLKNWARLLKRDVIALWLAARDPRVPWHAKVVAGAVAAYALSPIDLIPDFIPVIGLLDDLLIVPAGIALAVWLIPASIMADLRTQSASRERPRSTTGLIAIVFAWTSALTFGAWLGWRLWIAD